MEKLIEKGAALADKKVRRAKAEVKSVLIQELPDHIDIEETADGIAVQSPHLHEQLIDSASLRDVAFLMRGVR